MMGGFNIWRENPPPKETWVWAKYQLVNDPVGWRLVKTCRHGCCVYASYGCLLLPKYWRAATNQEGREEQARWDAMKPVDPFL